MRRSGWWLVAAALVFGANACTLLVPTDGLVDVRGDASTPSTTDGAVLPTEAGADGTVVPPVDAAPPPVDDPSLVLWFPFDEGSGITAKDRSKSNFTASPYGDTAPKWVPGHAGTALEFDGMKTCLEIGDAPVLQFQTQPFTVSAWLLVRDYIQNDFSGRFVLHRKLGAVGWHFGTDDPMNAELDVEPRGGSKLQVSAVVPKNVFAHVAMTYEPTKQGRVYVNGSLVKVVPNAPAITADDGYVVRLGCRQKGQNHFSGAVDDLRVYARILTEQEIAGLAK